MAHFRKHFPLLFFFVTGCTKNIQVSLQDAPAKLVIEGNVLNTKGPYYVRLTKSVTYTTNSLSTDKSTALVKISDNTAGHTDTLKEISPGLYATHSITGISGHTYILTVVTAGKTYSATSTMPSPVKLDSLTFQHFSSLGEDISFAVAHFADPPKVHNYYTFSEFINGRKLTAATFVFDDRLSNGKDIATPLITYKNYINQQDTVVVEMNCVDKNVYNYFYSLSVSDDPQNVSPTNPVSNISGNVLGYFSAQTVETKSTVIQH